ncbi:TetR/AcrR family transcriptional regulator [Acinetobacter rathckeae]|uniref:TetR/AcrR family transcriptional regulator n=1 Tax=Acinetobacter rathckeae TaxID=2605272 RepID=UPI0018A29DC2|nr:TetR/AcrR family transcriptional regulator [Acinetobacter rathckeae]MBF7688096.1 TetR/AcrR family transcriptional regulator [Acinetobacter rathckeae]
MSKSALKILETAEKLFNKNNFIGVGVDAIRDESGCSKTTMYTYFKNKNQLVMSVLQARDQRFKHSLFEYIGTAKGVHAIDKIFEWHIAWFQQHDFKGCLFVRAVAESSNEQDIREIAIAHKQWIKQLIEKHCTMAEKPHLHELIYTLIEGLISRCLVDGFDPILANDIKQNINNLLYYKTSPTAIN